MKRSANYILAIGCMVTIFIFSSQGHEVSSGQSMKVVNTVSATTGVQIPEKMIRKSAHVLLYSLLGVLIYNVAKGYSYKRRTLIMASVALVCIYAISDETHQYFVGGRSAEAGDVLLDTAAGSIGIFGYYGVIKRNNS